MLKVKDFGGSLNKQSSVMFNVIAHVPSHRFLAEFDLVAWFKLSLRVYCSLGVDTAIKSLAFCWLVYPIFDRGFEFSTR
jgi:hypothetical protein